MPRNTAVTIQQGDDPSSRSNSFHSEEESTHHIVHDEYLTDELYDEEGEYDCDEVNPSDSASVSNDVPQLRSRGQHLDARRYRYPPEHPYYPVHPSAPATASSVDHPEEYGPHGRGAFQPPQGRYYNRAPPTNYPQNHTAPYMGGYPGGNQMVPYGSYNNPFSPMTNGSSGTSYFSGEPRHMYEMAPYQPGYYAPHHAGYNLPNHMQQFHLSPPHQGELPGQSTTPAPKEQAPDPEKLALEKQIAELRAAEEKAKAAERQREAEEKIRKDAEEAFHRRMEDMRKAQEEAQRKIEIAKAEAERAARERMEAERKAEEERNRMHAEAMKRVEEKARIKFEAEMKAERERQKKEEADRARAEEQARIRLEAAIKAKADAKAADEKKAAEEAERLKRAQEEAKRKAEEETLAKIEAEKVAAAKAAKAEEERKKEDEALKKKTQEETKAKIEEAAKKQTEKAPIKFKDAVGRKFSFPFHLCSTWQGMEELIKQAFLQVDVLGPHVQEGHYDLIGPNGEIILPSVWEKVIEPDWAITMTMWPMDKMPLGGPRMPGGMPPGMGRHGQMPPVPPGLGRMHPMPRPGQRPGSGIGMPPPAMWPPGPPGRRASHMPANVDIIDVHPPKTSKQSKRNSTASMLGFFAGKPAKKKSSKK